MSSFVRPPVQTPKRVSFQLHKSEREAATSYVDEGVKSKFFKEFQLINDLNQMIN